MKEYGNKRCLIVLATAWGTRHGGINTFNYDICKALAKLNIFHIVCVVDSNIDQELEDATNSGIELASFNSQDNNSKSFLNHIQKIISASSLKPEYVLGHDIHTGKRATDLAKALKVKSAVFHHMNYDAYKSFQTNTNKPDLQRELLQKADIVFAIGVGLVQSAQDKGSDHSKVIEIQPGLIDEMPRKPSMPNNFAAVTFGRLDKRNNLLKQTNLVVASFAAATKDYPNSFPGEPTLNVYGLTKDEIDKESTKLNKLFEDYSGKVRPLNLSTYEEIRSVLFENLSAQSACMMLSIHEGFGLVGLEAISAEVPLILSKRTGLYLAIKEYAGDCLKYLYAVDVAGQWESPYFKNEDIEQVKSCLVTIANDKNGSKSKAQELRQKLSLIWTWEKAANQVINGLTGSVNHNFETVSTSPSYWIQQFSNIDDLRSAIANFWMGLQPSVKERLIRVLLRNQSMSDDQTKMKKTSDPRKQASLLTDTYERSSRSLYDLIVEINNENSVYLETIHKNYVSESESRKNQLAKINSAKKWENKLSNELCLRTTIRALWERADEVNIQRLIRFLLKDPFMLDYKESVIKISNRGKQAEKLMDLYEKPGYSLWLLVDSIDQDNPKFSEWICDNYSEDV